MVQNKINGYIGRQKPAQKEILIKIRKIFLTNLKEPDEKFQWGVITFCKGKFYLAALKDKIHVGFSINGLNAEEKKLFEGKGKTMRHLKIFSVEDINKNKITKLIKLVDKKSKCPCC
ncbi:MAG: DUF1801 domain-containing protein [archaeon]